MSDLIKLLKELKEELMESSYGGLVPRIDEALKDPELRIRVPKGELVVGVTNNDPEAKQAYICLDNEGLGLVDLCLCECVEEELRNEGEKEGDIRIRTWDDITTEDYTHTAEITAEEIDEQISYINGEEKV